MEVRLELVGGPSAAHAARQVVSRFSAAIPADIREDVRLLVSEIVTNAVRHGGAGEETHIELSIALTGAGVHIEVADRGPGFLPGKPSPRPDRASGWGLVLLDRLADRWGVDLAEGTRVWFDVQADLSASPVVTTIPIETSSRDDEGPIDRRTLVPA